MHVPGNTAILLITMKMMENLTLKFVLLLNLNQYILIIFLLKKLCPCLIYSAGFFPPEESYISPCTTSSLDFLALLWSE